MHPKRLNLTFFFIVFRGCIVRANRLAVRKGNPSFLLARCQEALAHWTVKSYSSERRVVLASEHARSMDIHGLYLFLPFFSRDARRGLLAALDEIFGEVLAAFDESTSRRSTSFFSRRTTSFSRDARRAVCLSFFFLAAYDGSYSRCLPSHASFLSCLSWRTTRLTRDAR